MDNEKLLPPHVTFEKRPVEDRAASIEAGHYVAVDVDYAIITPRGGKDRVEKPYAEWIKQQESMAMGEDARIPAQWVDAWKRMYSQWKAGEEMTEDGTPIKSWPVASPAQIRNLLNLNVTTVEQLAHANTEVLTRLGMGGVALKEKAQRWLAEAASTGRSVEEITALKGENRMLKERLEAVEKLLAEANLTSKAVKESAPPQFQV